MVDVVLTTQLSIFQFCFPCNAGCSWKPACLTVAAPQNQTSENSSVTEITLPTGITKVLSTFLSPVPILRNGSQQEQSKTSREELNAHMMRVL